ncbi:MAG: 3'(2'),5'-bisphosphate nucleotidase CysQ [Candidatus Binatia bacterium]
MLLEKELSSALDAARAAGDIIRSFYNTRYSIDYKDRGKDSPVTAADREANHKIHETLQTPFPHYGWLSEETGDSPARLSRERVWLVDPLDGTKEFINKIPEFAVSIALIEQGSPILGVVYNPIHDQLFWAVRGQGAWSEQKRLYVTQTTKLSEATILASRSETKRGEWKTFSSRFRIQPTGSAAYKMAMLAKGAGDATFTLTPKNEWDICAGVLLVEEAGGQVSHLNGDRIEFNQPNTLLQGLVASNRHLHAQLLALIDRRH